jgi:hypothetical protein
MKTKKIPRDNRYNIIIASLTDANKKARALTMSRKSIMTTIVCVALAVALSIGGAVFAVSLGIFFVFIAKLPISSQIIYKPS